MDVYRIAAAVSLGAAGGMTTVAAVQAGLPEWIGLGICASIGAIACDWYLNGGE